MNSLICLVVLCIGFQAALSLAVPKPNAKVAKGLGQSAFDFIQAERANELHNATITTVCGISCVTNLNDNDYIRFDNIDFQDGATNVVLHFYDPDLTPSAHSVTVYIDSLLSDPLATIFVLETGADCAFKEQAQGLNRIPIGIHTLYLSFTSDNPTENILDLDYVIFRP
ncbi:hypothetical protein CHUAL_008859 [Chamberlinius hualienensis]